MKNSKQTVKQTHNQADTQPDGHTTKQTHNKMDTQLNVWTANLTFLAGFPFPSSSDLVRLNHPLDHHRHLFFPQQSTQTSCPSDFHRPRDLARCHQQTPSC